MDETQELLDYKEEEGMSWSSMPFMYMYDKYDYLKRLFPSNMEQKPGRDYYGRTTSLLMFIAIFVLLYFDKLFVTPEELLDGAKGSNNIFSGRLALVLLFISCVIILERYISRADVKIKVK